LKQSDFDEFNHLLVMDHENYRNVINLSPQHSNKVNLITDFSKSHKGLIIPDPYFGNENDFKEVFKLLNEVSSEVAQHFHKQYK
jgi:protein-tyrosine phosphatase